MKRVIYFDFDGTLHDTAIIYREAVQLAYDELVTSIGLPSRRITLTESSKWLGMSPSDMWEDFLPDLPKHLKTSSSKLVGDSMLLQLDQGKGKLYQRSQEVLELLSNRGYDLKVLSNCKEAYGKKVTEVFELEKYISAFHCAETYQYIPKHEILREIGNGENIIAFIGDRRSDIEVGTKLGIYTIACDYGFGDAYELADADHHINDISDLLSIFQ